jgi:hypothetical protein
MWRYLLILSVSLWLGGLTFYGLVVVPIGSEILGSTAQGIITQQVTDQLNLAATGVLALLLINAVRQRGRLLTLSWVVLAVAQAVLFAMHPRLDAMLNVSTQEISDAASFHFLHEAYLSVTAVQWGALLVHLWCVDSNRDIRSAPETIGEPSGEAPR